MSHIYDNWERLVATTLRKQQDLELCFLSDASSDSGSSFRSLSSPVYDEMHAWSSPNPGAGMVPRENLGELIAAGWPGWLAEGAAQAIFGWVPRTADTFEKLDKIGQGTYSNVYRARDCIDGKIVALKKVRFDSLKPESVRFMAREILVLRRLNHPNIIKLQGLITSRMSSSLYLVFENMDHDLAGLAARPKQRFSEPQIKCYMQQLLSGIEYCHGRGVLHRDIKGANLLIDNNGVLKIADFGSASFYNPFIDQVMTSRVVSLWYRPPELLLGSTRYGPEVDLWSVGCILAELYAGRPLMPGRTEVEQLHKIFKLCGSFSEECWKRLNLPHKTIFKPNQPYKRLVAETLKDFPAPALALTEILLSIEPSDRGSAASALESDFFTTSPHPCDPSSLPKYPPSKEAIAKLGDKEARRATAAKRIGGKHSSANRQQRDIPRPEADQLISSTQYVEVRQGIYYAKLLDARVPDSVDTHVLLKKVPRFGYWEVSTSTTRQRKSDEKLAPLGKVLDEMLKEHDRQILQTIQRANKYPVLGNDDDDDDDSNNHYGTTEQMVREHNRQIWEAVLRARSATARQL